MNTSVVIAIFALMISSASLAPQNEKDALKFYEKCFFNLIPGSGDAGWQCGDDGKDYKNICHLKYNLVKLQCQGKCRECLKKP